MEGKKRLLVTASTFPRWENDTEPRFVLDLSRNMRKWYDVTVLVPATPGAKDNEILEGVHVVRYHYFPIHSWETLCYPGAIVPRIREKKVRVLLVPFLFWGLFLYLFKHLKEYDIVHAHWLIPQGIVQSFFRKTYIVTGHGGDVTSLNNGILRKLKIRCLKKAKRVTVVSNALKERIKELDTATCPEVISMGIEVEKFGKQYYVKNFFGQGEKKVVVFVGRLVEKKGVTYLIDAMKEIDAMLVIVGDGPLREELQIQAQKLRGKVTFLGAKTHEELKSIYASADIAAFPSVTASNGDQEGLGLVILEAMASGVPVVASASGGISQVIEDGKTGLLCKEKDSKQLQEKIQTLLQNDKLCRDLVSNARRNVRKYDYKLIARKYMEILE